MMVSSVLNARTMHERVMAVLSKRMERFGLTLHPQKTRLLDFRRPSRSRGEGRSPTTFDFLGFCWYWRRTRSGKLDGGVQDPACAAGAGHTTSVRVVS